MSINLQAVISGVTLFSKNFKTVEQANKYMEKKLDEYRLEVEEVIESNNNTEYKCDNYNRFKLYCM